MHTTTDRFHTSRFTAVAGVCAAIAGAIFIGVQVGHPPADLAHLVTTEMTVRETAKAAMSLLAITGLTGMLLRHRGRIGVFGRIGYGLVTLGYAAMFAVQVLVGYVLPGKVDTDPAYVQDVLDAAMGETAKGIGGLPVLFGVAGLGFSIGGLLFGIAMFRAGVLSRWASALFAYGTVSALALAVLPQSFSRPFAVPTGVALIGLGVSMWRDQRRRAEGVDGSGVEAVAAPVGAAASATR